MGGVNLESPYKDRHKSGEFGGRGKVPIWNGANNTNLGVLGERVPIWNGATS